MLGEYNKNSANPIQKLIEVQRENAFKAHTYRHTTMGFLKDIEDMPNQFEYSKAFFDRWYRPEYTTVIVAGDVKPDEVLPAGREVLGRLEGRGRYKVDVPAEPRARGPGRGARAVDRADAALGERRVPRARVLRDEPRVGGARRALRPHLRPDLGALQEPGGGRAEGRPARRLLPAERATPTC